MIGSPPLAYRVLQILPNLYRRWAAVRLRDREPFVDELKLDELIAGIGGQGVQDGSYGTAAYCEVFQLLCVPCTGGAADLYKCVDQIRRPFVY